MNQIEKRELIEQQRKVFEAGTQRADKRTGSFSFLTWPFFLAPLIASAEFLAATFKSGAAEEQDAKAAQAGAAPQAANNDLPASDPSKASAQNETTKGPAASSDAHAAQLDQSGLLAQSDEDSPKLSARSEATAASGGGGDGDSRSHDAHTSVDTSVNWLSADSHLGSGQLPGGSTLESVGSNVLGDSFSPSTIGSAPLLGAVDSLSGAMPPEAAVQLATVTDGVSTLSHDMVGAVAPVEAAMQPVLATVTDSAGTLSHDAVGAIAPVEAAVQPVLTTVGDTVGTLTHDAAGTIAAVEGAVQPVLATATDAVSTLSHDVVGTIAPAETAVQPVLAIATAPTHDDSHPTDAGNVAGDALSSAEPVDATTEPVLASTGASHSSPATDLLHSVVPEASTGQAAGPADILLALATSTDAPIEVPGYATAAPANSVTNGSNAAAAAHPSAIAGDVIALNDASPPPAHPLFTGTQYTDYGITLSSDTAVPPQHAVSPADTTSAHDTLVPVAADAQKHAPPPPDIVDATHSIDHLGHAML